eukprot:109142_1
MFRTDYWWDDGSSKIIEGEQQGFAGAAQAGAFLGAAATAIGVLTLVVLLRTVCFRTSKCGIITVIAMQSAAALFSLLTLLAGAADLCKGARLDEKSCKTKKIRIEPGAGFAISAAVFYICAVIFTVVFLKTPSGWENYGRVSPRQAEEQAGLVMSHAHGTSGAAVPSDQGKDAGSYVIQGGAVNV